MLDKHKVKIKLYLKFTEITLKIFNRKVCERDITVKSLLHGVY